MKNEVGFLALLFLSGCSSVPALVKVPVPVACQEREPEEPFYPTAAVTPADPLDTKVAAALAEIEIRRGETRELRTALRACLKPISP